MNIKNYQKIILIIIISVNFFIIESFIKYFLINKVPVQGFYFFFDLIQINLFTNQNIAFSLPLPEALIIILVIIILMVLSYLWWLSFIKRNYWQILAISLIIMGALSNLLDRLIFGYVIDYLNVFIWPAKALAWPVFNLADAMIVIGVLLYILFEFKIKKSK